MLPGLSYLGRTARDGATTLIASETQGLAFDFTDQSAVIIDTGTPANSYSSVGMMDRSGGLVGPAGKLTYSSPSPKMCMQSSGYIRHAPHNILLSSNFQTADWTVGGDGGSTQTKTNSYAEAPDGTTTAARLQLSRSGGTFSRCQQSLGAVNIGRVVTFSVWMRTTSGSGTANVGLRIGGEGGVNNVVTGTWQRFSQTNVLTTTVTDPQIILWSSIAGNDASCDIIVWGAQLNFGRAVLDYVGTTTAAKYSLPYEWNTSGVCQGLLVEEARTNLLTYSNTLSNAAWTKTRLTITADATTSPSGATDACKLEEDNTAASSHQIVAGFAKAASAIEYTTTFYAKQAERNWIAVALFDESATGTRVWFNLATGAVGTTAAIGAGFTNVTTSITSVGNGWYRCRVTATSSAVAAFAVYFYSTTADNVTASNGTTGSGLYIWNVQVEAGAFPTSPILTGSATVTRAGDYIYLAQTAFPASGGTGSASVEGTLAALPPSAVFGRLWSLSPLADIDNQVAAYIRHTTGLSRLTATVATVNQAEIADAASTSIAAGGAVRSSGAWATNDFAYSVNGAAVGTDGAGTTPGTAATHLILGATAGATNPLTMHIKRFLIVPRRRPNAELETAMA